MPNPSSPSPSTSSVIALQSNVSFLQVGTPIPSSMKLLGGGKRKKVTAEVVPSPSTSKKSGVEEEGISPGPPLNVGPSLDEILYSDDENDQSDDRRKEGCEPSEVRASDEEEVRTGHTPTGRTPTGRTPTGHTPYCSHPYWRTGGVRTGGN